MIHVKIAGLSLSNMGFVVLLRGEEDPVRRRSLSADPRPNPLPSRLIRSDRPLTHDLFKNVLDCMECRLKRVVINELTFYLQSMIVGILSCLSIDIVVYISRR